MQETDYSNFDLGDLAADEYFVEWVLRPGLHSDAFWTQWLEENPSKRETINKARLLVLMMTSRKVRMQDQQKENLWERIQVQTTDQEETKKKKPTISGWMYAAAAVVVILVTAIIGVVLTSGQDNQLVIAENPPGKTSLIHLEDGTKVWLNADSRLSYQRFNNADTRTVKLEGEAFFDVTEDRSKPFVVNTELMNVKVLGTAFNVRAYANDPRVETTLLRGRVEARSMKDEAGKVILAPNERAVVNKRTNQISVEQVDAARVASWKEGVLIFDNVPFSEVKRSLERRYGVRITLDDQSSLKCHFTGSVRDEPIVKVLELLQTTSKISYEIDGTEIRLKGSLCEKQL